MKVLLDKVVEESRTIIKKALRKNKTELIMKTIHIIKTDSVLSMIHIICQDLGNIGLWRISMAHAVTSWIKMEEKCDTERYNITNSTNSTRHYNSTNSSKHYNNMILDFIEVADNVLPDQHANREIIIYKLIQFKQNIHNDNVDLYKLIDLYVSIGPHLLP